MAIDQSTSESIAELRKQMNELTFKENNNVDLYNKGLMDRKDLDWYLIRVEQERRVFIQKNRENIKVPISFIKGSLDKKKKYIRENILQINVNLRIKKVESIQFNEKN